MHHSLCLNIRSVGNDHTLQAFRCGCKKRSEHNVTERCRLAKNVDIVSICVGLSNLLPKLIQKETEEEKHLKWMKVKKYMNKKEIHM